MKIDLKIVIRDYEGKKMETEAGDGKKKPLTVKRALNFAINGIELTSNGQQAVLTAEVKGRIYQLSNKLWSESQKVDFTVDEMAFIKERAGKVSNINSLVYGRICDLLENKKKKEVDKVV